jgi:hypothetical protein
VCARGFFCFFFCTDPIRSGLLDQPHYEHAMRSLLPNVDAGALGTAFVDHCDGTGGVGPSAFSEAFLTLCDPAAELWRRSLRYPPTRAEVDARQTHDAATHFAAARGSASRGSAAQATGGGGSGGGAAVSHEAAHARDDELEARAHNPSGGLARDRTLSHLLGALWPGGAPRLSSGRQEARAPNGGGRDGVSGGGAAAAWATAARFGGALAAGAALAVGAASVGGRAKRLAVVLRREGAYLVESVQATLQAVLEEEKLRAEKEQADRYDAEEALAACCRPQ